MPEKLTAVLHVRVTTRVCDELYRRARKQQRDLSELLRDVLEQVAKPEKPVPPKS
jgi:hypothetical protein